LPRHWRKNHDRLIKIVLTNGEVIEGRITSSDEIAVTVAGKKDETVVAFADIKRATVEIEFNRKADK
jgi:ribosome maturation factor RimP